MTPRLSVVVPFYNVADYIGDCLSSIARSTLEDIEVILVDDGSRDSSADIAHEFARADHRFRVVTQENQGLGPARNTGTRHATGDYLTFVDSDDLIPRYAYELMVRTLDESGSSFAAGDARRFNNAAGVRESYLHRIPFATDRTATHVFSFPQLALDRMAWNKVYRRTFWDEFKYEFPAIRYEDYPVTLKAHLDAVSVDCIAAPVYFWRERESGESITQRKFDYTNLLERVVSAEMVMDLVDKRAPELRSIVHQHFAIIDLAALAQAFGSMSADQTDDLLQLGRRFTSRLDDSVLARAGTFQRIQYFAMRTGDTDLLQRLAQFQLDGGLRGGVRAHRSPGTPWRYESEYPGLHDGTHSVPREVYRLPRNEVTLSTSVTEAVWDGSDLIIRGTAEVKHLRTSERSSLKLTLCHGKVKLRLPVERFETLDSHGEKLPVGFETRVPRSALVGWDKRDKFAMFKVDFTTAGVHRSGDLRGIQPGSGLYAEGRWVSATDWVQPGASRGRFVLRQLISPWFVSSVEITTDELVINGMVPAGVGAANFSLTRFSGAKHAEDLKLTPGGVGQSFAVRVPLAEMIDEANPDDPFTMRTSRAVEITSDTATKPVLMAGLDHTVGQVYGNRLITLTRSPGNYASLVEGPIRSIVDAVAVQEESHGMSLVVGGTLWGDKPDPLVWRRFVDGADHHVDVACEISVDAGRWSALVDVADLAAAADEIDATELVDPMASLATWSLYAVPAGDSAYGVHIDAYQIGRLPLIIYHGGRRVSVASQAGTFHVEVR